MSSMSLVPEIAATALIMFFTVISVREDESAARNMRDRGQQDLLNARAAQPWRIMGRLNSGRAKLHV